MADVICDETVFLLSCCDLTSRSLCNIYAIMTPFRWLHHQEFGVRYVEHSLIKVVIFVKRTSLIKWNPSLHYIATTSALHCHYISTTETLHWRGKIYCPCWKYDHHWNYDQAVLLLCLLPSVNKYFTASSGWLHTAIRLLSSREANRGATAYKSTAM